MVDDSKCTTLPKPPVCVNPLEKCFVVSGNTITSYLTNDSTGKSCPKNVVIPSTINGGTVTTIGSNAFKNKWLTAVTLPSTIQVIWSNAFQGNALTTINLPAWVTTLANWAFAYNQISSLTIPSGVTSIGNSTFRWNRLRVVSRLPSSITSLWYRAFADNPQLTRIEISRRTNYYSDRWEHNTFHPNTRVITY